MDFNIVTSADENYNFFLKNLAKNIQYIFGKKLYVYDLGLSESTKQNIFAEYINLNTSNEYKTINKYNCIKATHKPDCIIDFCQKSNKPFIFIDADCIFTKKINFPKIDICFTFRHYCEQTMSDFVKNGLINSGVIFFLNQERQKQYLLSFLTLWKNYCSSDPELTDQMALSNIITNFINIKRPIGNYQFMGLNIGLLESEFYNDVKCKTGYIFHFKSAVRRNIKLKKYIKYNKIIVNKLPIIDIITSTQRLTFFLKKIFRPQRYKYRYKNILPIYIKKITKKK